MKQIISIMLCLGLIFPTTIFAQEADNSNEAKLVEVEKNDPAPFSGVLLNAPAAAQMLANKKYLKEGCEIKIDYELSKLQAQHDLVLKSLQISLETTEKKYDSILLIKDEEIKKIKRYSARKLRRLLTLVGRWGLYCWCCYFSWHIFCGQ